MKRAWLLVPLAALAALMIVPLTSVLGDDDQPSVLAVDLGNGITYQGRFEDDGEPADGSYDIRFILFDAESGGAQVGSTIEKDNLTVTEGIFTTTLDFGAAVWDGDARWLEIAVRPGSSTGNYTVLNPRQPVTAVPYALHALTAGGFSVPFTASGDSDTDELLSLTQDGDAEGVVVNRAATDTAAPAILGSNAGAGAAVAGTSAHASGIGGSFTGTTAVLLDGGISVAGADPAAFTVVVDVGTNTCDFDGTDDAVVVTSGLADGTPSAFLFVTYDATGAAVAMDSAYAVSYGPGGDCPDDQWIIYRTDAQGLVDDGAFNVLVINQG